MLYFSFEAYCSRNDFWPCHFLFSFLDFFGIADVLIKAQQIIRTLSFSLYAKIHDEWGVDRIKQLFGMCVLNLFLREVFMLRLAIKSNASLPQWTLWRILSIKFYEAKLPILWRFWNNHEPTWIHSFMWNLNFPALEEGKVKRHSQLLCWDWKLLRLWLKIEFFDRRGK